jgi:hypothetical protein
MDPRPQTEDPRTAMQGGITGSILTLNTVCTQARQELPPERLHGRVHRQHDTGVHLRRPAEAAGEPERELDGRWVDLSTVGPNSSLSTLVHSAINGCSQAHATARWRPVRDV